MPFDITENTIIDVGIQLSRNFNLSHLTSGAYNPVTATWMPKFSATLIPDSRLPLNLTGGNNMPLWKIVSNLQSGARGMLEGLLGNFGPDLIIKAAFMNNIPQNGLPNEISHLIGLGFDIQIRNFEDNMYNIVKEIQPFTRVADSLNLVNGAQNSWLHVDINPNKLGIAPSMLPNPQVFTSDLVSGITTQGLSAIRGFL
jgi:hypothetical protein